MMPKTGCKVCESDKRESYERLRLDEDKTFTELENIAKERFDEQISHATFWKHFKEHDLLKKVAGDQREEKVKDEIDETLDIIQEMKSNLKILRKMAGSAIEKDVEDLDSKDMKAAESLLKEIRITLTTLSELTNELRIDDQTTEGEQEEFYRTLDELEPDMHKAIVEIIEEDTEPIE